ncbi:zinc finger protein 623-like isoform X2 [Eurosta solidaginis]|uniref:zinc finger protein 623-like isoform X2 n=1 Tax=Eurosta solidaginis TaxID=178769 RepID=UPI003530B2A9
MTSILVCAEENVSRMVLTPEEQLINSRTEAAEESILDADAFIIENAKCFLCDRNFIEGEGTFLIFKSRLRDDGEIDNPLSIILSTALGKDLDESSTHSALLCESCNRNVLEFEKLLQKFCQMRIRIITSYNQTVQNYNVDPIVIDFNAENNFGYRCDSKQIHDNIISDNIMYENETPSLFVFEDNIKEDSKNSRSDQNQSLFIVKEKMSFNEPSADLLKERTDNGDAEDCSILNNGAQSEKEYGCHSIKCEDLTDSNFKNMQVDFDYLDNEHKVDGNIPIKEIKMVFEQQGSLFACLLCDNQCTMSADIFAEHLSQVHTLEFYTCEICVAGFLSTDRVKQHIEQTHITSEKNECNICQKIFDNNKLLYLHKRSHISSNSQFECSECHKIYSSKKILLDHMNIHTGRRPYICTICSKDFSSKYALQMHMKIHSERLRPYKCDKCNKAFLNLQNLTHHKKLHTAEKTFICDICSKAFGSQHNLDVHKIVHSGQRPFICRTCGKTFARRAEIKDHERIHTGEKPYKCDMCNSAFAQRSNLMTHRKSTHLNEKLHNCNQCGRSFKRRRLLQYHINAVHTGVRPHECEICGSSFVYPEHKKKHMLIHANTKPYPCEVCGKEFNSCANRNAHRFVHSSKKPYECIKCGAGFMRKPLLLTHMNHAGHTNDRIIINQPQISDNGKLSLASERSLIDFGEETNELISHSSQDSNKSDYNEATQMISNENDSIINDVVEIASVQYLQFDDLDKNGQHIITWVDIGRDKDDT